jgi:Tissue inhibitor of metalloproteinase
MTSIQSSILILSFFVSGLFQPKSEPRCSCISADVQQAISNSDVVLKGEVISLEYIEVESYEYVKVRNQVKLSKTKKSKFKSSIAVCIIKPTKVYKGDQSLGNIVILTHAFVPSCGVQFIEGKTYIVYRRHQERLILPKYLRKEFSKRSVYWTEQCDRTTSKWQDEETRIENIK